MKKQTTTEKRMLQYGRAVMRLAGKNIGPNARKDALETAKVMNELSHCTTLFMMGLGMAYGAAEVAISTRGDENTWVVSFTKSDGRAFHAEAKTIDQAAIELGEQVLHD
jgi:hypothetical protein